MAIPKTTVKTIDTPASKSIPKKPNKAPAKTKGKRLGIKKMIIIRTFFNIKPIKRAIRKISQAKPSIKSPLIYVAFLSMM